jgi:hypothetical protein
MKFLYWDTANVYEDFKEIEINTLDELIELIKKTDRWRIVMRQDDTEFRNGTKWKFFGKRFIENYNDYRE